MAKKQIKSNPKASKGNSDFSKKEDMEANSKVKGNNKSSRRNRTRNNKRGIDKPDRIGNSNDIPATKCDNDMSWYIPTPELVSDTNNFTFYQRLGDKLDLEISYVNSGTTNWVNNTASYVMPGIMSIEYKPVLTNLYHSVNDAKSTQNLEGINMAARMLKSRLRLKNTGTSLYDAPDLARYCMACGSAIAIYSWLVRLYGISRLYTQQNSYFPIKLMRACGCECPDEFINSPTTVRAIINRMALQLNSLVIPKIFPLIDRQVWLNSKILSDGISVKSQLYVFKPTHYFKWFVNGLAYDNAIYTATTIPALRSAIDEFMNSLLGDVSVAIISGDILKTYTGDVFSINQIPEDVAIAPEFMPQIMDEIQNIDIAQIEVGNVKTTEEGTLYQTYSCPTGVPIHVWNSKLLNVQNPAPTAEDVMYATRLAVTGDKEVDKMLACGTEIVSQINLYSGDDVFEITDTKSGLITSVQSQAERALGALSQFKYHPIVVKFIAQMDGKPSLASVIGDIENYTTISHEEMLRIHDVAKQGLFGTAYGLVNA